MFPLTAAYNAFVRYGRSSQKWCAQHKLNYKALLRAVSIRKQLSKYLERFNIPVESCEGDAKRLRKCLVTGYFKVSRLEGLARMFPRTDDDDDRLHRTLLVCCLTAHIGVSERML
jgi:hypothetical protein